MRRDDEMLDLLSDEGFQNWVLKGTEDAYWTSWVKSNPDKSDLVQKAKKIIKHLKPTKPQSQSKMHTSWSDLSVRILEDNSPFKRGIFQKKFFKYVAAIAMVSIASWLVLNKLEVPAERVVYQTGYNEKRDVLLSDQTSITLNSNTSIEVYNNWEDTDHREVKLIQGEAFFNVTKQTESNHSKFRVLSHGLAVEVLGTKFNMKSRRGQTATALVEGSIAISLQGKRTMEMKSDELIIYDEKTGKLIDHRRVVPGEVSWLDNKIMLNNATLVQVAEIIEDNYGVQVLISKPILLKKLSGELPDGDLDILMEAISKSLQVNIVFDQSKNRINITQNTN